MATSIPEKQTSKRFYRPSTEPLKINTIEEKSKNIVIAHAIEHQRIAKRFLDAFTESLQETDFEVLYGVQLSFENEILEPDILVYAKDNYVHPKLIVEVLSADSVYMDLNQKIKKYPQMNIAEYWIADPKSGTITIHDFVNDKAETLIKDEVTHSFHIPELKISVNSVFPI